MTLAIHDLTFKSRDQYQIIEPITLTFFSGNFYVLLGLNGSGKSTLLKILAGILKPSFGNLQWNDQPIKKNHELIAFVPQNPSPQFDFTVEELVAMGRYPHLKHYWDPRSLPHITEALTFVNALHLKDRSVLKLSDGEVQRVYIARALAMNAPIMLLDEPTASLDIKNQIEVWNLLQKLTKQGKLIIMATHDLQKAEKYCDEALILKKGRCMGMGPFSSMMETIKKGFEVSSLF